MIICYTLCCEAKGIFYFFEAPITYMENICQVIFFIHFQKETPLFSSNPLLKEVKKQTKDIFLCEWDNFSEPYTIQKTTQILKQANQFILITQTEADASVFNNLKFLEQIIASKQKGNWFFEGRNTHLEPFKRIFPKEQLHEISYPKELDSLFNFLQK